MVTFGTTSFEGPINAPLQTEKRYAECLHDILDGLLFLSWDYLISQEMILFELSSWDN